MSAHPRFSLKAGGLPIASELAVAALLILCASLSACSATTPESAATSTTPSTTVPVSTRSEPTQAGGNALDLPTTTEVRLSTPTTIPSSLNLPGFSSSIDLQKCELTVTIANSAIGFGQNSAALNDAGVQALGVLAVELAQATEALVVGHTSTEGESENNQLLSEARAQAVADALAIGAPEVTFEVRGAGETQPLRSPETTEEERSQNRRVVVQATIEAEVCI